MISHTLRAFGALSVALLIAACSRRAPGPVPDAGPPTVMREMRGLWVATVRNIDWPSDTSRTADEQRAELDLSSWKVALNGAEPVQARTLRQFAETFGPAGFRESAFYPCYGLAEATLMVSGGERETSPVARAFDPARQRPIRPAMPDQPR